ncbi:MULTISPECIES: hypothetical protein [unclassified Oceanispirochaeta]|uniref:hypothetical protein n=1 Tax=unclassified Oceanispirochaeta TaxID=2635722 RepID=UPI0011C01998|nr:MULTISPECIES: hypothetical protein [unclassified Oceanispirochaeta]MBF9016236.1 hypothetical protein [Oceanispirochaeta sp. M2]
MLSTRAGFNLALGHFKTALSFSSDVEGGYNLADVLSEAIEEGSISPQQLRPVLNILLVDKFSYQIKTENLRDAVDSVDDLIAAVSQWTMLDVVLAFYNSSGDISVINPSNKDHWAPVIPLKRDELMVCFIKSRKENDLKTEQAACIDLFNLLYGKKIKVKKSFINPDFVAEERVEVRTPESKREQDVQAAPEEAAAPSRVVNTGKSSAKISVLVTNELFHNGNVEAWKKIMASYKGKHPGLDVNIWYDGEKINDINTLFKWGKVKHGTPIIFNVVGDDIKDVSKLKKYFFEGASARYEVFLRGAVNSVLDLF